MKNLLEGMNAPEQRKFTQNAVITLCEAYKANIKKGPVATLQASVKAQGKDKTMYALAYIVTQHAQDGRISRRNKAKAAEITTWSGRISQASAIHPAHVDNLMNEI